MATAHRRFRINAAPDAVWKKMADLEGVHELMNMLKSAKVDGDRRVCKTADGGELHERIIAVDPERRRLVYTITGHRCGSAPEPRPRGNTRRVRFKTAPHPFGRGPGARHAMPTRPDLRMNRPSTPLHRFAGLSTGRFVRSTRVAGGALERRSQVARDTDEGSTFGEWGGGERKLGAALPLSTAPRVGGQLEADHCADGGGDAHHEQVVAAAGGQVVGLVHQEHHTGCAKTGDGGSECGCLEEPRAAEEGPSGSDRGPHPEGAKEPA